MNNSWNEIERAVRKVLHEFSNGWCTRTHTQWDVWGQPHEDNLIRLLKETAHKGYLRGRREAVDLLERVEKFRYLSPDCRYSCVKNGL